MKYKILGMKQAKSNKGLIYEKKYKEHKDKTQKIIKKCSIKSLRRFIVTKIIARNRL